MGGGTTPATHVSRRTLAEQRDATKLIPDTRHPRVPGWLGIRVSLLNPSCEAFAFNLV